MNIVQRIVGYDPTITHPTNVPSYAREAGRTVTLSHPSNDPDHPAARAAWHRYTAKGFTVEWEAR